MAIKLILPKPINISLQSKPTDVIANFNIPQNGAWDIIYFCRMDNGVQVGTVHRLGKVIDIAETGTMLSGELVSDGDFQLTTIEQPIDTTGNYWTTENNWIIFETLAGWQAIITSADSETSTLSQSTLNPSILPS